MEESPRKWTVGVRTETQGSLTDRERNIGWFWNFILHLFSELSSYEYAHSTCVSIPIFLNNLESFFTWITIMHRDGEHPAASASTHWPTLRGRGNRVKLRAPQSQSTTHSPTDIFFVCSNWRQSANTNKPAEETKEMRKKNSWSDPEVVDLNKLILHRCHYQVLKTLFCCHFQLLMARQV